MFDPAKSSLVILRAAEGTRGISIAVDGELSRLGNTGETGVEADIPPVVVAVLNGTTTFAPADEGLIMPS